MGYVLSILVMTPTHFVHLMGNPNIPAFTIGMSAAVWNLAILGLFWRGLSAEVCSHLTLAMGSVALAFFTTMDGGPFSVWSDFYSLVPLAAFVLVGTRGALAWTVLSVGTLVCLHIGVDSISSAHPMLAAGLDSFAVTRSRVMVALYAGALVLILDHMHRTRQGELERALDAEAQARDTRNRFLAHMSHELRTPMNGVLGLVDVMLQEDTVGPENKQRLLTVSRSGNALVDILNDVLDLAAAEQRVLEAHASPTMLVDLVRDTCEMYRSSAVEKGLQFDVFISEDVPLWGSLDRGRTRHVLARIVGSAVKCSDKGHIVVDTCWEQSQLKVTVRTPGSALHAEMTTVTGVSSNIPSRAWTKREGELGLGVSVAQVIVAAMGGRVEVEDSLSDASVVTVWLPVQRIDGPPGSTDAVSRKKTRQVAHRLLIVEDMPVNQMVLTMMVQQLGWAADVEADGLQALDTILKGGDWDVILMDWQLPGIDGVEITRRARAAGVSIPIVCVTAHARDDDRQTALEAGMEAFLSKPVRISELRAVFTELGLIEVDGVGD